jgi:hypothetical protein
MNPQDTHPDNDEIGAPDLWEHRLRELQHRLTRAEEELAVLRAQGKINP